jgi:aminoglycoside 6'-N-acetyltransferase
MDAPLPTLRDGGLVLRPQAEADLDALVAMIGDPSVGQWWGMYAGDEEIREDLRHDGTAFTIESDDTVAGWLGVSEEPNPDYRYASLDISLRPEFQDRGLGAAALRLAMHWLLDELGHHRLTIDPNAENARAIHVYESLGFRAVGIMRQVERGPDGRWRDGLLMDLLAEDMDTT